MQSGFTLMELMVVVTIIGIIISFGGLSLGQHSDQRLETEAKRIHHLIKLASDEAIMQSREYAVRFAVIDYVFLGLDASAGKFVPIDADKIFRRRELDPDIKLVLEVEGQEVELLQSATSGQQESVEEDTGLRTEGLLDDAVEKPAVAKLSPAQEAAAKADKGKTPVDIYILSSGEITPFKLTLSLDDGSKREYTIEATFSGDIAYRTPNSSQEEGQDADGWSF
ncbi:MAG: prepilin-type N-terminal cleavage/methylation domain-containing protein [Thiohalomonadales bacterium]